jgi:hypothetical protein
LTKVRIPAIVAMVLNLIIGLCYVNQKGLRCYL